MPGDPPLDPASYSGGLQNGHIIVPGRFMVRFAKASASVRPGLSPVGQLAAAWVGPAASMLNMAQHCPSAIMTVHHLGSASAVQCVLQASSPPPSPPPAPAPAEQAALPALGAPEPPPDRVDPPHQSPQAPIVENGPPMLLEASPVRNTKSAAEATVGRYVGAFPCQGGVAWGVLVPASATVPPTAHVCVEQVVVPAALRAAGSISGDFSVQLCTAPGKLLPSLLADYSQIQLQNVSPALDERAPWNIVHTAVGAALWLTFAVGGGVASWEGGSWASIHPAAEIESFMARVAEHPVRALRPGSASEWHVALRKRLRAAGLPPPLDGDDPPPSSMRLGSLQCHDLMTPIPRNAAAHPVFWGISGGYAVVSPPPFTGQDPPPQAAWQMLLNADRLSKATSSHAGRHTSRRGRGRGRGRGKGGRGRKRGRGGYSACAQEPIAATDAFIPQGCYILSVVPAAQGVIAESQLMSAPTVAGLQRVAVRPARQHTLGHAHAGYTGCQDYHGVFAVTFACESSMSKLSAYFGVLPVVEQRPGIVPRKLFLITPIQGTAFLAALAREIAAVVVCRAALPTRPVTPFDMVDVPDPSTAVSPLSAKQPPPLDMPAELVVAPAGVKQCTLPLVQLVETAHHPKHSLLEAVAGGRGGGAAGGILAREPTKWNFLHHARFAHWSTSHVDAVCAAVDGFKGGAHSGAGGGKGDATRWAVSGPQPNASQVHTLERWLKCETGTTAEWNGPWPHQFPHWAHEVDLPAWYARGWRAVWKAADGDARVAQWTSSARKMDKVFLPGLTFPSAGHVPADGPKGVEGGDFTPGLFEVVWARYNTDTRFYPALVLPPGLVPGAVQDEWERSSIALPVRVLLWWLGHRSYGIVAAPHTVPLLQWDGQPAPAAVDGTGRTLQAGRIAPAALAAAQALASRTLLQRQRAWMEGSVAST